MQLVSFVVHVFLRAILRSFRGTSTSKVRREHNVPPPLCAGDLGMHCFRVRWGGLAQGLGICRGGVSVRGGYLFGGGICWGGVFVGGGYLLWGGILLGGGGRMFRGGGV